MLVWLLGLWIWRHAFESIIKFVAWNPYLGSNPDLVAYWYIIRLFWLIPQPSLLRKHPCIRLSQSISFLVIFWPDAGSYQFLHFPDIIKSCSPLDMPSLSLHVCMWLLATFTSLAVNTGKLERMSYLLAGLPSSLGTSQLNYTFFGQTPQDW